MIDLGLRRRRASDRVRSSVTRWVGRFEVLESRIALSNGLVGVAAEFIAPPTHIFTVTSVPQDPNNTGAVTSTTVTVVGNVVNPLGGAISDFHTMLEIAAFENGTNIGSVSWDVTAGPGTITGPSYLGQDPTAQNEALFSLPFTLQSATTTPQNVTFQITAVGFGTRSVVLQSDGKTLLTGTFVVTPVGPMVSQISPVTSPRTDPVQSIDVTFSKAIDPTTFTTAALTLTNNGTAVPLASDVTFTSSDNTTFTVGGLSTYTTAFGSYVFTVSAAGVKDPSGTAGTGSQSVDFTVQSPNAPPTISHISPITSPRTEPVSAVGVTFSKAIDPTTFTTADLTLTRDGAPVTLGPDVTFTTTDDITFSIGGLASYTTPPAPYSLTISAAGVKDLAGNPGIGSQSVDFTVQAPVVDTGPQVVGLQRFGVHNQPTLLVLTFDRQLDPVSAGDLNNYLIYSPGRHRRIGTAHDVLVPIFSGVYDSANRTVTLVMARPLYLFGQYRIVVRGTGPNPITDQNGVALDGKSNGIPGSNFTTIFGREILVGVTSTTTPTTKAARYQHYQIGG
ncbi:MAG: Ig-like domain-containing protein [Isosphaerales bacterium]